MYIDLPGVQTFRKEIHFVSRDLPQKSMYDRRFRDLRNLVYYNHINPFNQRCRFELVSSFHIPNHQDLLHAHIPYDELLSFFDHVRSSFSAAFLAVTPFPSSITAMWALPWALPPLALRAMTIASLQGTALAALSNILAQLIDPWRKSEAVSFHIADFVRFVAASGALQPPLFYWSVVENER